MITQQEVVSWRAHAPWNDDHMVEQDFLICRAVGAIFGDGFLGGQVALRGGTVLHKSHLAPASRYSEDIDLVLVGDRPVKRIEKALVRVLSPIFGVPYENVFTTLRLAIRNLAMKSTIIRQSYTYNPASPTTTIGTLKIEVNTNENKPLYELVTVPFLIPAQNGTSTSIQVKSYDINEMLGTKLRALLQREHGRDLYDLYRAYEVSKQSGATLPLDPSRVAASFAHYMNQEGSTFSRTQIEDELARRMKSQKFRKDMDGYLPNGVNYSVEHAHTVFCEVFLPHL